MARPTIEQRLIAALLARGYVELTATRYVKATAFRHPTLPTRILFVGKNGSLRIGQNRTTSVPVSSRFKNELLAFSGKVDA
jgi:hypothetical protein